MATSWPQETAWPAEHREHATHLTKYLRDTLNCIDRSQDQPVPVDLVRLIIHGTISLIAKVQRVPDLSSIYDNLQVMQAQAKTAGKETTQALSKISEGMSKNRSKIQKTVDIAEEVKALAQDAAEVGQNTAGILKDIKNKGLLSSGNTALNYAAAAANGTVASNVQVKQNAQTISIQTQREITVNIRELLTIQSLRAMNPRNLKAHVERAIANSGNEQIMSVKVMSSNQLKSGDLSIRTTNSAEAQALWTHASDWAHRIGAGATVRNPTYGILAHGTRTSTMDMNKFDEARDNIIQDNRPFIPKAEIKYIGWLTRTEPSKSASSVIIEFTRPRDANKIIEEGLVWQGEMLKYTATKEPSAIQ
ncbi:hypothetical protein LTR53_017312 [Teratosphaeriaceae sp. CCFEE 6253]|nr:hypothetical protein LTR53_017312 [Teratosphaeriaceae sp. CCFEE 6253]